MVASIAVILFGIGFTATRLNLARFDAELSFRGAAHDDLAEVLADPRVRAGLKCGPLTTPNHKLVPDTRWIADLPYEKVRARADPDFKMPRKGVAIYVNSRFGMFRQALSSDTDSILVQVPRPGYERVKVTRFYAAYVSC
jgi:hypothetical protein